MRRTWILLVLVLAACGGNSNGNPGKQDTSPDDVTQDEAPQDIHGSELPPDSLPGDLAADLADLMQDANDLDASVPDADLGADQTEPEDQTEIWWDFQEDNTLPLGCGNAIIEDPEVCDGGSKPCKDMLMNFISGNAYCKDDCTGWSTAGCITNGTPYCGNGVKEGMEACDETPKLCSEMGSAFTSGTAVCSFDCMTYDLADCQTDAPVYGYLTLLFDTPFILDDDQLENQEYLSAHKDAFITVPAFTGTYGATSKPIPNPAAQSVTSYALRDTQKKWLYIQQEAVSKNGEATEYQNPQIEMHFGHPDLEPGDYPLNALTMGANRLYLFNTQADGTKCILGVAVGGHVIVTKAVDTEATDGGQLAFEGHDIPIYYVAESPYGQALVTSFGTLPVCAKE